MSFGPEDRWMDGDGISSGLWTRTVSNIFLKSVIHRSFFTSQNHLGSIFFYFLGKKIGFNP